MNLKGGYKIIDLSSISLVGGTVGGDYTAITDEKILEQLLSLKDYLDDSKELKPIYLRAKTSGKETVMAELAKKIGEDILYIDAKLVSSKVQIKVVFERDAETQEISIDEAGYLYVSDADSVMADVAKAESGTIVDVLGLDADGALVKGAVSGGTKLYKHRITIQDYDGYTFNLITASNQKYDGEVIPSLSDIVLGYNGSGQYGAPQLSCVPIRVSASGTSYYAFSFYLTSDFTAIVSKQVLTDTVTEL